MPQSLALLNDQPYEENVISPCVDAPVVIIGNGPVGMHAARELLVRKPDAHIVIYGNEQHQPYNRVKLSYLLSGELNWNALLETLKVPETANVDERIGYNITHIDSTEQFIEDAEGNTQAYSKLILATGSHPHIPNIPGIDLSGVFTFRSLNDTNKLLARQVRTQTTVVLGGGLLGIEAARGMQRSNTSVSIIEHADRLLGNLLDEEASETLENHLRTLGIHTVIGDGVSEIIGSPRVSAIKMRSGRVIDCDTVIVATGIRSNIELAKDAGLAFSKGIRVNDNMLTSIPNIYAVGECAEHRDKVYGVVSPGLEQASVAISHILGQESQYQGSIIAARLKVVGCPVFSTGPVGETASRGFGTDYLFQDSEQGIYRKILVHKNRLIGAIGVGEWRQSHRVQSGVTDKQWLWPWQLLQFTRTGNLWQEEEAIKVVDWPANAAVCQCTGATRGSIGDAIQCGASSVTDITTATGAAGVCGSCRPLVQELLGSGAPEPAPWHKTLSTATLLSFVAILLIFLSPVIPFTGSVQIDWRWDQLWRDNLFKQISGYSILGLFALGLLVSPRKRIKKFQNLGRFDIWRLFHIALGLLVIAGLVVHTGMRFGHGINFALMLFFTTTLLLGAAATAIISQEHHIGANATLLRRRMVWWHIILFWPVPIVLGLHIMKSYYF